MTSSSKESPGLHVLIFIYNMYDNSYGFFENLACCFPERKLSFMFLIIVPMYTTKYLVSDKWYDFLNNLQEIFRAYR